MADHADAAGAVALAEALEAAGAEAEVRFGAEAGRSGSLHPDAVIVADPRGYRITRHHPILEAVLPIVA
ncbi:MAG TPA: hypothetical protein VLM40_08860 [Gemmata sp.]|nr:hypothetical protein [Gemmata sp.]